MQTFSSGTERREATMSKAVAYLASTKGYGVRTLSIQLVPYGDRGLYRAFCTRKNELTVPPPFQR